MTRDFPVLLVGAVLLAAALADDACTRGEQWDNGQVMGLALDNQYAHRLVCPGVHNADTLAGKVSEASLMMMFTPPSIPWRYTGVCFMLTGSQSTPESDTVWGTPSVFLSVEYHSCTRVWYGTSLRAYPGRANYWMDHQMWIPRWLYGPLSVRAIFLRADGEPYNGIPPGWSCNKSWYKDGVCNCECV
eukprot:m51a1_g10196 hypothetical protein (188) ;mRNA; r:29694-32346